MSLFEPLVSIAAAAATIAACVSLGALVLRLWTKSCDWELAFLCGAASLSVAIWGLSWVGLLNPLVFVALLAAAVIAAWRFGIRPWEKSAAPWWVRIIAAFYGAIYFIQALVPEATADGSGYHLGFVRLYFERGAMFADPSMYASFPQGLEMLYLMAYGLARGMRAGPEAAGAAASLVHLAFLAALTGLIFAIGRRAGAASAGYAAGLVLLASPVIGVDAASANNDVAVAASAAGAFLCAMTGLWGPAGLLAGFAFGIKYTAVMLAVWPLLYAIWKTRDRRTLATVAACMAIVAGPWLLRNWLWRDNPVAPFFNRYFPNPHQYVSVEESYRANMAHFGGAAIDARWPMDVTIRGERVQSAVGVAFLLAPVALFAIRAPLGGAALCAAVFLLATYPANLLTRFLVPALPFIALAIALVLARWQIWLLGAWVALQLIAGLPFVDFYGGWRIREIPWRAALRSEPSEAYLRRQLGEGYDLARLIEKSVPPEGVVYTALPLPDAYAGRQIVLNYTSALGNLLYEILYAAVDPAERIRVSAQSGRLRCETCDSAGRVYEAPRGSRVFSNRWDADLMLDRNPATFWSPWGAGASEIELTQAGEVTVSAGRWISASGAPAAQSAPEAIRPRDVIDAFQRSRITHLVIHDQEGAGAWVKIHLDELGLTEAGAVGPARLYRISR